MGRLLTVKRLGSDLSRGRVRLARIIPASGGEACRTAAGVQLWWPGHVFDMAIKSWNSNRQRPQATLLLRWLRMVRGNYERQTCRRPN